MRAIYLMGVNMGADKRCALIAEKFKAYPEE
jgi:hypothetical protein